MNLLVSFFLILSNFVKFHEIQLFFITEPTSRWSRDLLSHDLVSENQLPLITIHLIDSLILQHQNQYSNLVNEILHNTKLESSKAIQMNEYTKWKFNFVKLKMKETQKKVKKMKFLFI